MIFKQQIFLKTVCVVSIAMCYAKIVLLPLCLLRDVVERYLYYVLLILMEIDVLW